MTAPPESIKEPATNSMEGLAIPVHYTVMRFALRTIPSAVILPFVIHMTIGITGYLVLFVVSSVIGYLLFDRILWRYSAIAANLAIYRAVGYPIRWFLIGRCCVMPRERPRLRFQRRWQSWTGINPAQHLSGSATEQLRMQQRTEWLQFATAVMLVITVAVSSLATALLLDSDPLLITVAPFATISLASMLSLALHMAHIMETRYGDPEQAHSWLLFSRLSTEIERGRTYHDIARSEIEALVNSATGPRPNAMIWIYAYLWALDHEDWTWAEENLQHALQWIDIDDRGAHNMILHESAFFAAHHAGDPERARSRLQEATIRPLEFHTEARILASIHLAEGADSLARATALEGLAALSPTISRMHAPVDARYLNMIAKQTEHIEIEAETEPPIAVQFGTPGGPFSQWKIAADESRKQFTASLAQEGVRPRDYDLEPIEHRIALADRSEREAVGWLHKYWHLLDSGDIEGAEACIDTAFALCTSLYWLARVPIFQEMAFFSAYFRQDPVAARHHLKWSRRGSIPPHTRARVLGAVLYAEGRFDEARQEALKGISDVEVARDAGFAAFDESFLLQILAAATNQTREANVVG